MRRALNFLNRNAAVPAIESRIAGTDFVRTSAKLDAYRPRLFAYCAVSDRLQRNTEAPRIAAVRPYD
jgi:hypothetical protein